MERHPAAQPPLRSPSEGPAGTIRRQAWFLGKRVPRGRVKDEGKFSGIGRQEMKFPYILEQGDVRKAIPGAQWRGLASCPLLSCAMMIR
jgi:hypothetical protein